MLKILLLGLGDAVVELLQRCLQLKSVEIIGAVDPSGTASGRSLAFAAGIPVAASLNDLPVAHAGLIVNSLSNGNHRDICLGVKGKHLILDIEAASVIIEVIEGLEKKIDWFKGIIWENKAILNSTHDAMIMIDASGRIKLFNSAAASITGLSTADAIGRQITAVVPNSRLPNILKTGQPDLNQQQVVGGTTVIANCIPVRDEEGNLIGAVAVFRDITEIKKMAEEITDLQEVRQLLEAIINSTQDAISVVDKEGKGILINPAYTRLTGLIEEDVIGKPPTVDIAEGESMHLRVLKTGKPVRGAVMKVGPMKREVIVQVAPIMVDSELKGSVAVIHDISEIKRLNDELERAKRRIRLLEAKYTFDDIIGSSRQLKAAVEQARRAADTPATVLLRGESGTGKELFAHAIHNASKRRKGQFIRVNCSAIAESLLESELFGYEGGAFTGARRGGRKGLFEEANGGTILLDEIAEIRPPLQAKLLRVLQEKEILRVGSTKPIPVDVRVIAATNIDLEKAVRNGAFREDLYYRINVVPIFIAPLRSRKEDIPQLIPYLLRKFNQEFGRNVESVAESVMQILLNYDWPGNVRELENVLGRAMINMRYNETIIQVHHLPLLQHQWGEQYRMTGRFSPSDFNHTDAPEKLQLTLQRAERNALGYALKHTGGNKTEAARLLGISIRSLYYKLEKHGLAT